MFHYNYLSYFDIKHVQNKNPKYLIGQSEQRETKHLSTNADSSTDTKKSC